MIIRIAYKIVGEETGRGEKEWKVPFIEFILVLHIPGGGDAVVPYNLSVRTHFLPQFFS